LGENDHIYGHNLEADMSTYSVAAAKAGLPDLINRAMAGEEVIITRHGKPVAEIRPAPIAPPASPASRAAMFEWLASRRLKLPEGAPNSVELLNMIYDEPNE
jgi:prevent-host-death family protein